jgi:hypothetical protein
MRSASTPGRPSIGSRFTYGPFHEDRPMLATQRGALFEITTLEPGGGRAIWYGPFVARGDTYECEGGEPKTG